MPKSKKNIHRKIETGIKNLQKVENANLLFILHLLAIGIIVFLICSDLSKLNFITVLNDEFGYWGIAASLAGYDWKELIAETPYYSYGYSLCLVPFIFLFSSSAVWYKAAILLNTVFLILSYFICYGIGKKLFPSEKNYIVALAALITTIYPSNIAYAQVAWSETLQYFLVLCITYMFVLIEEKFSVVKGIFFVALLVYLYCVHNRNIGVLAVSLFCFLILIIKNKKMHLSYFIAIGIFVLGYILSMALKNWILRDLWSNSVISEINNINVNGTTVSMYWKMLTGNLYSFIESLYGKFFYLLFGTGFTVLVAVIAYIKEMVSNLKSKNIYEGYPISKLLCIGIILMMWGMSALQAMNWKGRKDIILYARYMEQAIGPVLLIGILYTIKNLKKTKYIILTGYIIFLAGLKSIYIKIADADSFFNSICVPIFGTFYDNVEQDLLKMFHLVLAVAGIFILVCIIASVMKKEYGSIILVTVFIGVFCIEGYQSGTYVEKARANAESKLLPVSNIIEKNADAEIYYIKNEEQDLYSVNPKYLQFMVPDRTIHVIEQEKFSDIAAEEVLLLLNGTDQETKQSMVNDFGMEELVSTDILSVCCFK